MQLKRTCYPVHSESPSPRENTRPKRCSFFNCEQNAANWGPKCGSDAGSCADCGKISPKCCSRCGKYRAKIFGGGVTNGSEMSHMAKKHREFKGSFAIISSKFVLQGQLFGAALCVSLPKLSTASGRHNDAWSLLRSVGLSSILSVQIIPLGKRLTEVYLTSALRAVFGIPVGACSRKPTHLSRSLRKCERPFIRGRLAMLPPIAAPACIIGPSFPMGNPDATPRITPQSLHINVRRDSTLRPG